MNARDWRPWDAASLLRQAREAATPTADLELVAAAIQTVVTEIETLRSLSEGDPSRGAHFQRGIEQLAKAGEHLARVAAMEGDGNEIPF